MPKPKYVLSAAAKADIKAIAQYTVEHFGKQQSISYSKAMALEIGKIVRNPERGRRYLPIKNKMLFRHRFKLHVIFYYLRQDDIVIVRVLGNKMDYQKHL